MTETRRLWQGGPLRQWAAERVSASWIPYARRGYVGPYVCEHCQAPNTGVYRTPLGWVCASCKRRRKAPRTVELRAQDAHVTPRAGNEDERRADL